MSIIIKSINRMAPSSTNFFQNVIKFIKYSQKNWSKQIFKLFWAIFTFFRSWNTSQTFLQRIWSKMRLFQKKSIFGIFLPISATFKKSLLRKCVSKSSNFLYASNVFSRTFYFRNLF
jgi:hypothetical protein